MAPKIERRSDRTGRRLGLEGRASPPLERHVVEALGLGPAVARRDEVARDVDAQHVGAEPRAGNAVVPSPHPRSRTFIPA